jgi:hypothetical protein
MPLCKFSVSGRLPTFVGNPLMTGTADAFAAERVAKATEVAERLTEQLLEHAGRAHAPQHFADVCEARRRGRRWRGESFAPPVSGAAGRRPSAGPPGARGRAPATRRA